MLGKTYESPLQKTVGAAILGSDEFVERITAKYLAQREIERDVPALRQLPSKPSAEKIIHIVEEVFGDNKKVARQAGMQREGSGLELQHYYKSLSMPRSLNGLF